MARDNIRFKQLRYTKEAWLTTSEFVSWLAQNTADISVALLKVNFDVPEFQKEIQKHGLELMSSSDGLIGEVNDDGRGTDLSRSSTRFVLHTDGPYYETPPEIIILHCLKSAHEKAWIPTILRDTTEIIENFSSEEKEVLQQVAFVYHGSNGLRQRHPLIESQNGHWCSNFGGRGHFECLDEKKYDFFTWNRVTQKFINLLYSTQQPLIAHNYVAGDTLVFNNHQFLHGRENVSEKRDYSRKLLRIWVK